MESAIVITNWCLLVFFIISLIGWRGAKATYRNMGSFFWHDLFSWALYIALTILAMAGFARLILFLITGD